MKLPFIDQNFVRIVGRLTKKADDLHDEAQVLAIQSAVMAEQAPAQEEYVCEGISLGGIYIGGMSRQEVYDSVESMILPFSSVEDL